MGSKMNSMEVHMWNWIRRVKALFMMENRYGQKWTIAGKHRNLFTIGWKSRIDRSKWRE